MKSRIAAVVRSGATGTATQNSYIFTPDQSRANFRTIGTQTFTLSQQSVVQIPFFFKGTINFFGSGTNDSAGFVVGGVSILDAGSNTVYNASQSILQQAAQGNVGTNLFGSGSVTLAAWTYTVKNTVEERYVPNVQVRVIGSANPEFVAGPTDLRGVFVADGINGNSTVIAKAEAGYAFHRGKSWLGSAPQVEFDFATQHHCAFWRALSPAFD